MESSIEMQPPDKSLVIKFNKCASLGSDKIVVLIVCGKEYEKRTIAKALVHEKRSYKLDVHVTGRLPLASKKTSDINFDFIVFVMNAASRSSLRTIEESLQYVDLRYFQGHCCFVVVTCLKEESSSTDLEELGLLGETYSSPVLYSSLQDEEEITILANNILSHVECASGLNGSVTPSYLEGCSGKFWKV